MGFLTLLPLFGVSAFLARGLKVGHGAALLFAVSCIVLALYLGGLLGILRPVALGVHALGFGLLAYESWRGIERADGPRSVPVTYGLLALFCAAFWLVHRNSHYFFYDEFSHWGVFTKEMLANDGFWLADTNSMHPRYPPGSPLWQYLFTAFQMPTEGKVYFGQFVFLVAPLMVLFGGLRWRQVPWAFGITALLALVLSDFGHGVASLYVDHVLGTWFIGTILCCLSADRRSVLGLLPYAAALGVIALTKGVGIAFAAAAASIIAALVFRDTWRAAGRLRAAIKPAIAAWLLLALPAALCTQIWSWNRDRIGAPRDIQPISDIAAAVGKDGSDAQAAERHEVTRRFLDVFFNQQLSKDAVSRQFNAFSYPLRDLYTDRYRLTTFSLLVAFVLWWLILVRFVLPGESKWTWGIAGTGVLVTAIGYIASLYLTYLLAAGDRATLMSSYIRYVHSIALPIVVLCFAPLLPAFGSSNPEQRHRIAGRPLHRNAGVFCAGLLCLYVFETPYLRPLYESNPPLEVRNVLEPTVEAVRSKAGRSKLWVYLPQDRPNGFIGHLLQYLLSPTPATIERSKEFAGLDADAMLASWAGFDLVWFPVDFVPGEDVKLVRIIGESPAGKLFRIERDRSQRLAFRAEPLEQPR